MESAGFTHPSLLRLFKRYGVLHFCAVLFIIISAGLWYGYSEHLETTLEKYPKARGSKVSIILDLGIKLTLLQVIIDFSRAYWYIVVAAVSALFGAALNVLRIYDDSIDEDQQRLIPEEMRFVFKFFRIFLLRSSFLTCHISGIPILSLPDRRITPSRLPTPCASKFLSALN